MARTRSPDREKAEKLYIESNGAIKLKEIADTLGLPEGTVRGWKNKDKWEQKLNGTFQKETKKKTERSNKKNKVIKEPIAEEVKEVLENTELTDKQRLFCIYYVKYFNATKAALKAGYSKDTAYAIGYENLNKPKIKAEIQRLKVNKLNRAMLSEDDIFQKYIDIAFADITDYVEFGQEEVPVMGAFGPVVDEETGEPVTKIINTVKFKESINVDGTLINEVKQGRDGASIKLQDKIKALQWLSDRMDLLPTETKIKIDNEKAKVKMAQEKLDYEKNKDNKNDKPIEILIKRKGED